MKRIAVIGGGINGAGIAWELVRRGDSVTLFDKGRFGAATSSATSKLIHGGLRYLEHFEFRLVRESLRDRAFLLRQAPDLVHPLEFILPIYQGISRPRWMIEVGLTLYDILAGRDPLPGHRRLSTDEVLASASLKRQGLRGGFLYLDAQVDDGGLVRRVVERAVASGLEARESTPVVSLQRMAGAWAANGERFDAVIVAAGPWMDQFLSANEIPTRLHLMLVRGSHIFIARQVSRPALLLQSPGEDRVFFVIPWKGETMIGTTEVLHQGSPDEVHATPQEIDYLVERFNFYFEEPITAADVLHTTSGVRPLIGSGKDLSDISRDYKIEVDGSMIKVFGGKLTTFLSLSRKVADRLDAHFGIRRRAEPPIF